MGDEEIHTVGLDRKWETGRLKEDGGWLDGGRMDDDDQQQQESPRKRSPRLALVNTETVGKEIQGKSSSKKRRWTETAG